MKKERNYTIEFVRFVFAISFLLIHVYAVVPRVAGANPPFVSMYDAIIPFMAFSGFFLMQSFQKNQAKLGDNPDSAGRQAWLYLKGRIRSLMPLFAVGTARAGVGFLLVAQVPVIAWPKYFLDILQRPGLASPSAGDCMERNQPLAPPYAGDTITAHARPWRATLSRQAQPHFIAKTPCA